MRREGAVEVCRDGEASVGEVGTAAGKALHSSSLEETSWKSCHSVPWLGYNQSSHVPLSPKSVPLALWWPSVWWNWPISPSPYGSSLPPSRQYPLPRLAFALAIGHFLEVFLAGDLTDSSSPETLPLLLPSSLLVSETKSHYVTQVRGALNSPPPSSPPACRHYRAVPHTPLLS